MAEKNARHYAAIFVTIVLYSTVEVVSKKIGGHIDPILLAFLRFFIPGVLVLAIGLRRVRRLTVRDAAALLLLGLLGITVTFAAYHTSLTAIDASAGAVIFSLNPVFAAAAAVPFLGERFALARAAGLLAGFAGVYILSFGWTRIAFSDARGPALMLLAAACFAFYVALGKKYVLKYGPFFVTGFTFVAGSVLLLPLVANWRVSDAGVTAAWVAYLALFTTGLGYVLYFYGLRRVSVAAGSSMFYLKPVLATGLAVLVLGERLTPHFFAGLLIIFAALALTLFGSRARNET